MAAAVLICDWFSGGGVGVWDCTGSKVSDLGSVGCPLTSWSVTISRVPNSVMRNWKTAKHKLEIIWWKVVHDSPIKPKQNVFNSSSPTVPYEIECDVFILPFSKHERPFCFYVFWHQQKHEQNCKFISHPDITAWKCCNPVLPIQCTHHVKLSSLGGAVTGWSVSHSHSSEIPNLQRKKINKSAQSHIQTEPADIVRHWSGGGGRFSYAVTGACVCLDPQTAPNSHRSSFLPALVNSNDRHHQ